MFDHEDLKVYFRGQFLHFSEANISVANTGFLYGLAVFTGMRAHINDAKDTLYIFRPEEHYRRLRNSCKLFRYEGFLKNYPYEKFLNILRELIQLNQIREDCYIRATNFSDENRVTPKFVGYKDAFTAFLYPLGDYVPTGGMRCKVSSWVRVEDNAIPARCKINGLYVNTGLAKTEALLDGYDEAIFLDQRGHVVEGSAENIFLVFGDTLVTPSVSDNILEGITRDAVIKIAQDLGISVIERSIDRSELYIADEVFLTGTGAKVSPVIEIDRIVIGDGTVGPVSKKLQALYFSVVKGQEAKYLSWLEPIDVSAF